jgi:hypothetical protein
LGELSNYGKDPDATMTFNNETGMYEASMFLKQGYYDYQYAIREKTDAREKFSTSLIENDTWETENIYMVLVYFRPLGGRYDELIGIRQFNSQFNRALR